MAVAEQEPSIGWGLRPEGRLEAPCRAGLRGSSVRRAERAPVYEARLQVRLCPCLAERARPILSLICKMGRPATRLSHKNSKRVKLLALPGAERRRHSPYTLVPPPHLWGLRLSSS